MEDDWHTVHTRTKDKKQRQKEKQNEKQDEPASKAVATAADPFAEFDRAFADREAQRQQQKQNAFAELEVDETSAAEPQDGAEEVGIGSGDEGAPVSAAAAAPARTAKKPKAKPVRKHKLTVAQVAAGKALDCCGGMRAVHKLTHVITALISMSALQPKHDHAFVQTTHCVVMVGLHIA
jgi:hypothetical protein